jgi:hypothetical protein
MDAKRRQTTPVAVTVLAAWLADGREAAPRRPAGPAGSGPLSIGGNSSLPKKKFVAVFSSKPWWGVQASL